MQLNYMIDGGGGRGREREREENTDVMLKAYATGQAIVRLNATLQIQ